MKQEAQLKMQLPAADINNEASWNDDFADKMIVILSANYQNEFNKNSRSR